MIVLANRSGGKTYDFAILDTMVSYLFPKAEIATVGAIQTQAQRCYNYFKEFSGQFPFGQHITKSSISETVFDNDAKVQVLIGTVSGVNSPHPQFLFLDEIDLFDWFVLQQAMSMPQSKHGLPSRVVLTSTRKYPAGSMQRLIDEADERGYKSYTWCIWEVMEKWPSNPVMQQKILGTRRGQFQLASEIPEGVKEVDGYYSWEDLTTKYGSLDQEVWENEWLCKKPGAEGIIYGRSYSDENNLLSLDWSPKGRAGTIYLAEDFGFGEGHPDVVLFCWVNFEQTKIVVFDELYLTKSGTGAIWEEINDKLKQYGHCLPDVVKGTRGTITGWVPDYHGYTEIADRELLGAPMIPKVDIPELYKVENGISIVKRGFELEKILITRKCPNLRWELLNYKKKKQLNGIFSKDPTKVNDHGPDALRYLMVYLRFILDRDMLMSIEAASEPVAEKTRVEVEYGASRSAGDLTKARY